MLQLLIIVVLIFYITRDKARVRSADYFNGEKLSPEDKKAPILTLVDSRPSRSEWKRVIALSVFVMTLPFIWYWIAISVYNIPPQGAAFIGGFFWTFVIGALLIGVYFPLISRPSFLQIKKDGISNADEPDEAGRDKITWEELGKMEFHSVVNVNIAITSKTGERWIRGLTPNALRLIETIVKKGWDKDIENRIKDIEKMAVSFGMKTPGKELHRVYRPFSDDWRAVRFNEQFYLFFGMFGLVLLLGLVFSIGPEYSFMGYILMGLSFLFVPLFLMALSKTYNILLRPGRDIFDQTKSIFENIFKDLGIAYHYKPFTERSHRFLLRDRKGYFGRTVVIVSMLEGGNKITIWRGSRANEKTCQEIMRRSDKVFDATDLKRAPPLKLR
jgi:hypothetical protein